MSLPAWEQPTLRKFLTWPRGRAMVLSITFALLVVLTGTAYEYNAQTDGQLSGQFSQLLKSAGIDHQNQTSKPIAGRDRILLKIGGIPQEGFGSSLSFMRAGIRMAAVLGIDYAPVRTFDSYAEYGLEYNVVDELNLGLDFSKRNWNNMCNLHTTITKVGGHENFPDRVVRLRQGVSKFVEESANFVFGREYDAEYLDEVRENTQGCDVLLFADQEVHQIHDWDPISRAWTRTQLRRNSEIKIAEGRALSIVPKEVHVHYRWGDVTAHIKDHDYDGKWNFDNEELERSLVSIEKCLGRKLESNVFMKRSPAEETAEQLKEIIYPVRQDATIIQGEDDVVDLYHLSQAKILAITGGSYSATAAAIGNLSLVIHNGWHPHDHDHLGRDGVLLLEEGEAINEDQCIELKRRF